MKRSGLLIDEQQDKMNIKTSRKLFRLQIRRTLKAIRRGSIAMALVIAYSILLQSLIITPVRAAKGLNTEKQSTTVKTEETSSIAGPLSEQRRERVVVFGPKKFERKEFQTRYVERFKIPENVVAPFTIKIQNGETDGAGRIFDGSIVVNGLTVAASGALNLQTPEITTNVNIFSTNVLEITFLGRAKSSLTITIEAIRVTPIRNPPVITGFSPDSGAVGTTVTLTGTNLIPTYTTDTSFVTVTFAGPNNTRRIASISSATLTEVKVIVPNGAVTGAIELANDQGRASTATAFNFLSELDFQLNAAPSTVSIVQRSQGTQVVSVVSGSPSFTQLVTLSVSGLPSGVMAVFEPNQITAGAISNVNLNLVNANLNPGTYSYTITGVTEVDGRVLMRTVQASMNVLSAGQTTLSGRVLSTEKEPIMGASVSIGSRATVTDAAGNFILVDVTAGSSIPVQIDGRTANAPGRSYPTIQEPANIVAGQANIVPYIFYLPPIDTQYEVPVVPTQPTMASNPRLDNLMMTIPANANLHNRDGSPVARVSITPLAPDRTPAPLPSNVATNVVFTSQPGGALPNPGVRIPVVYPNIGGANPGTQINLYAFNHDTVQWYIYGQGTVSADGKKIVPNAGVGLTDFSWHFPAAQVGGNVGGQGGGGNNGCGHGECGCQQSGGSTSAGMPSLQNMYSGQGFTLTPVDLSTGVKIEVNTDIEFGGARGTLRLERVYTSDLGQITNLTGPFGRGTTHNYDVRLIGNFDSGGTGRVAMPGEIPVTPIGTTINPGRLFSYIRTDTDGALVFSSTATTSQLGDVVRKLTNGTFEYRYLQGDVLRFDSSRRLIAMVDRNGNTTTLSYTGSNLTSITDAVGRSITLTYDGSNRITKATDPLGRDWSYAYENGTNLTKVTDPTLNIMRYGYTGNGLLASVTDKLGVVMKQVTYQLIGGAQRVTKQTFADASFEDYTYQLSGNAVTSTTVTDSLLRSRTLRFNVSGQIIERQDELGQTVRISRDLMNNLPTSITGSCGCTEETRLFASSGNLTSSTDRQGRTATYEYDANFNLVTKITDKLNRITTFTYDNRGNLLSVLDPLGRTTTYAYDGFGQLTSITDPLSHTTSFEYDTIGNLTAIVDALNHRVTIEYDLIGRRTAMIDALNRRTTYAYDSLDRLLTATDPNNKTTTFTYDANDNLSTRTNALNQTTTFAYNNKNNLTSITDPLGNITKFTYNANDELTTVRSPLGRVTKYAYDGRGQVKTITDALNNLVRFSYDNKGNLSSLSDERSNITTFTYDELSRLTGRRDPLGKLTSYSYDAEGNLTGTTDRLNRQTTVTYDGLNRPTHIVYADATVDYTYDAAGRLTQIQDTQGGTITRTYDNADRLLSETTTAGQIAYSYNNADQRTSMTADNRPAVNYAYDSAGRLQTITQASEVFTYSYDNLSRIASLLRPNGVKTDFNYDAAGRLSRLKHANASNQTLEDFVYAYNSDSEIEAITSPATSQQLATAKTVGPADGANRITQFGGATYSFNLEGQTTSKTDNQGTTNYTWDARGRMTQATLPNGQSVNYAYDALGRRVSRNAGGITTQFLYDREDVVLDKNSNNANVDYLNGSGIDNKLRQFNSATGNLYFLQDHLGSTSALTNNSGGVAERLQYEAYGNSTGSALTRYDYTGRERDSATGLMFYRARWVDPLQGRFMSEDPIGFDGGINLYQYVFNNPVMRKDPNGLNPLPFLIFIAGAAALIFLVHAIVFAIGARADEVNNGQRPPDAGAGCVNTCRLKGKTPNAICEQTGEGDPFDVNQCIRECQGQINRVPRPTYTPPGILYLIRNIFRAFTGR